MWRPGEEGASLVGVERGLEAWTTAPEDMCLGGGCWGSMSGGAAQGSALGLSVELELGSGCRHCTEPQGGWGWLGPLPSLGTAALAGSQPSGVRTWELCGPSPHPALLAAQGPVFWEAWGWLCPAWPEWVLSLGAVAWVPLGGGAD